MSAIDPSLLQEAVEGDTAALRVLLEHFGGEVRKRISGRIDKRWRASLDEDDVMQVTYLEAFLHIDQLTARDSTSFLAWLTRIAENALRDAVRGLTRQKRPDPARRVLDAPGPDSYVGLLECLGVTTTTPSHVGPPANEPPANVQLKILTTAQVPSGKQHAPLPICARASPAELPTAAIVATSQGRPKHRPPGLFFMVCTPFQCPVPSTGCRDGRRLVSLSAFPRVHSEPRPLGSGGEPVTPSAGHQVVTGQWPIGMPRRCRTTRDSNPHPRCIR